MVASPYMIVLYRDVMFSTNRISMDEDVRKFFAASIVMIYNVTRSTTIIARIHHYLTC